MGLSTVVGWERDAPEWSEVLAAARHGSPSSVIGANPLWRVYGPVILAGGAGRPFVIGQIGQSIDGRVATASGESRYINGAAAIIHLHRLRALVDAVVVGVGTAVTDDPRLTVRHVEGRSPARVIVDPSGRLPSTAQCLRDDGVRRIVVQTAARRPPSGIECVCLPATDDGIAPGEIIAALAGLSLRRILVEGGATTLSRFLAAGQLERLHVMIAPMIIGSGQIGIRLPVITALEAALRPPMTTFALPGGDILCDCAMGSPSPTGNGSRRGRTLRRMRPKRGGR